MDEDRGAHAIMLAIVGWDANDAQAGGAQSARSFVRNGRGILAFPYRAEITRALWKKHAARRPALVTRLDQDVGCLY